MTPNEGDQAMAHKEQRAVFSSRSNTSSAKLLDEVPSSDNERLYTLQAAEDPTHCGSPKVDPLIWAEVTSHLTVPNTIDARQRDILFENLTVHGKGSSVQIQQTVLSALLYPVAYSVKRLVSIVRNKKAECDRRTILHGFDGIVHSGELLLVLGRPGSGCSTFLKSLCGYLDGLDIDPVSEIQYKGIPFKAMMQKYRGEVVYNQETDHHFPNLTVGQTLEFAAHSRAPHNRGSNLSRDQYVKSIVKVVMDTFGLSHAYNTNVGNDYVPGVSGGERKRVSIAETVVSRASVVAWDNSTRGLDAATAVDFVRALRTSAKLGGSCHAVAVYQASEALYNTFDQIILLYEGREIYFGPRETAVSYFEMMGWKRPLQQVSADFLTAITNPGERQPQLGMEDAVPRTPVEFEAYWKQSREHAELQTAMRQYKQNIPLDGLEETRLNDIKRLEQATRARPSSPYLLSVPMQIRLCIARAWQRTRNDIPALIFTAVAQMIISLIIGSLFYNIPQNTAGLGQRASILFLAVLTNALISLLEITTLYSQRLIVEKQAAYAFVHPFTEAIAGVIVDFPIKVLRCVSSAIIIYFLADLRREASHFFVYVLFQLTAVMTMSTMFRTLATITRTIGQAMSLAGIMIICVAVYTGFTVPQFDMRPWFGWIRWLNPIFYAFEAIVSNEFHGRRFECVEYIPNLNFQQGPSFTCAYVGSVAGERYVSGDAYIADSYDYSYDHVWRNYGILVAFLVFFYVLYFWLTELIPGTTPAHEVLIFRSGDVPEKLIRGDVESGEEPLRLQELKSLAPEAHSSVTAQKDTLSWKGLCYDIPVKGGEKRLLDDVSGWIKPGSLTALMGVSGAGKTTLMNVLAQRMTIGIVTGDILVNGHELDDSFARKTGYVPQQDLHVETCTIREALRFSAALRQPQSVSIEQKYAFVEEVIQLLGMEDFAEAVIGNPGDGLNMEQRKLLSIGVELTAKPQLLIFLDEPTSGLDSRSSWAICAFMRKLADHGQPILATIHQPSAVLFEQFDRLLFLAKGGKTVYFGDIGNQAQTVLGYLEKHGARHCGPTENPAEYMLEVIGGGTQGEGECTPIDWVHSWKNSSEHDKVLEELDILASSPPNAASANPYKVNEFAMPLTLQFYRVMARDLQQYYRQPEYILAKFGAGVFCGLFIGFSFWKSDNSSQGFQNVLFSLFLLCTIFSTLVNQIMPKFLSRRTLYELRERPAKTYSWKVFILCQILVELPWQALLGLCTWASFYFSVYGSAQSPQRQVLILLFTVQFFLFASTFAQLVIAAVPNVALGSMLSTFAFLLCLLFNGIMQPPSALPRFWTFMNRVSPLTYYVGGISATALHGRPIHCSDRELRVFDPPRGQNCGEYLVEYLKTAPGTLYNPLSADRCQYCPLRVADQYLAAREISWDNRWRNFGIFWAYIISNIIGAIGLYYLFRVLPYTRKTRAQKPGK
ncbi:uncharacterized protein N7479_011385 [Penicillium vulpinum]|uniref:ABC transporter domain-containing protein n=1 Tax=Penicillium vulpinum TaxID=29845 RepID=A0A1V6RY66_9EURO|nr:uncharacterized protein N7479_011385 [Penicillium vulpinum]KAJ5952972.1 hypothetical protein N7479_011385 [Penicillium vulpinum]OQE06440.1 hypothetical protein PENVUL_c018G01781 [Penicillium vulpinum]